MPCNSRSVLNRHSRRQPVIPAKAGIHWNVEGWSDYLKRNVT